MAQDIFNTGAVANQWNVDNVISSEDILEQMAEAKVLLNEHNQKMHESAQEIFKECFGADFKRGDIVLFPQARKATYDLLKQRLTSQLMQQIKLDETGGIDEPTILNGDNLPRFNVYNRPVFN
jgi:hypothetical protein